MEAGSWALNWHGMEVGHPAAFSLDKVCRWFDLVIVLQCDNSILYERLAKR